jgi:hypothetical protein
MENLSLDIRRYVGERLGSEAVEVDTGPRDGHGGRA